MVQVNSEQPVTPDEDIIANAYAAFVLDGNTCSVISCNAVFKDLLGYSAEGGPILLESMVPDNDYKLLVAQVSALIQSDRLYLHNVGCNIIKADGTTSMCLLFLRKQHESATALSCILMPDAVGGHVPYLSSDTRGLLMEHFGALGFGSYEWFADSNTLFCSQELYRLFELDNDTRYMSADAAYDYVAPDDRARVASVITEAVATNNNFSTDVTILAANGETKILFAIGGTIKDKEGRLLKVVGVVKDVTTERLAEMDMRNQVSLLNDSNKELEEFAYIASHDMQEPLRKVNTFSSMLSERYGQLLEGEGILYLDRIKASIENMKHLLSNLLDFSTAANSKVPFEKVDLNNVVQNTCTALEFRMEEAHARVNVSNLPVIDANSSQLEQLFLNLLSNAFKFRHPEREPVIDISSTILPLGETLSLGLPDDRRYYKITVKDNGIGFEEQYAARIFKVFQRLHGKSEFPGSGIGLAICQKIVSKHQGVIYAAGTKGNGASFTIILPEKQG